MDRQGTVTKERCYICGEDADEDKSYGSRCTKCNRSVCNIHLAVVVGFSCNHCYPCVDAMPKSEWAELRDRLRWSDEHTPEPR